jgi:peptide/nickel transport system permease protein
MQRFLIRRFFIAIITLMAVSVIIFALARASGDPRYLLLSRQARDVAHWDAMGVRMGLDKSLIHQYGIFIKDLVQGDFGKSLIERRPARDIIGERMLATFQLGAAALLWSTIVGVSLGILGAVKRDSIFDRTGKMIALVGQSAPSFWIGIMLMFFFAVRLGWVPPSGRDDWNSIILPAVTLGWWFVAVNMRLIRSGMLDVLDSEYIKLARAKGASQRSVIFKHALKNALIPALTFAGISLGTLVAGSVTTEIVFAWPGLGRQAVLSMLNADYPVLQGVVIIFTLLYVTSALLVDILYAYIDPRIRYA